jgi:hypothetical protein
MTGLVHQVSQAGTNLRSSAGGETPTMRRSLGHLAANACMRSMIFTALLFSASDPRKRRSSDKAAEI